MYLQKCSTLKALCYFHICLSVFYGNAPVSQLIHRAISLTLKADQPLQHGKEKQGSHGVPNSSAKVPEHKLRAPHLPLATHSFLYPLQSQLPNEPVTSEAPSPGPSFATGKQLSHEQA